jgi:hypothetical protein
LPAVVWKNFVCRLFIDKSDQNYFTDQTELEVMSYVETYQEATRVEIL